MNKKVCFFVHKKHALIPFWSYVKVFKNFAECIGGEIVDEGTVEEKIDDCDFLIGDDWDAIELSSLFGPKYGPKIIPYTQTLYGLNTLRSGIKGIKRTIGSFLPLHFISRNYVKKMKMFSAIFANSAGTASILSHLYNLNPTYILHPGVNPTLYKPASKKEDKVLIFGSSPYLNSIIDPIDMSAVNSIIEEAKKRNLEVHAFGRKVISNQEVINHEFIPDEELVKLYSSSLITFTPQLLELYGLVPVESALCGTPFISTYFHDALIPGVNGYVFHPKHISMQFDKAMNLEKSTIMRSVDGFTTFTTCQLLTQYVDELSYLLGL
jgi:glycosyltransferase involved in cell wall biosynthesis